MEMKPKGHSSVSSLSPEQQAKVDQWLFDENRTYDEVAQRSRKEFGTKLSLSSIGRHYRRHLRVRNASRRARIADEKKEMRRFLENTESAEQDYKIMLQMAVNMVMEEALKPEKERNFRKVGYLIRAVTAARVEANDSLRANTIREKFEFDAATACLLHKIEIDEIAQSKMIDDGVKILAIRRQLFGPDLPE